MTARVLVVDDVPANVKLLEAKLSAEYYEVITAVNGQQAIEVAQAEMPDIILLDVMMPVMDGFTACRKLKENVQLRHIPVIMITALDQPADRVQGLLAGADDFISKPIKNNPLFPRVRSLIRLKMMTDELRARDITGQSLGLADLPNWEDHTEVKGRILIVDDQSRSSARVSGALNEAGHDAQVVDDSIAALKRARAETFDLIIVSLSIRNYDGLRLCSQLRTAEETRTVPLLIIVEDPEDASLARGLDMGVNDYLVRPIESNELFARIRTQLRWRRYEDRLRHNLHLSLQMAVTDGLTGLYNRRYMESHLQIQTMRAKQEDRPISLLMIDIDFFKHINDAHGHDAGDKILKQFALGISRNIRGIDLACRFGGEEFVVIMPETDMAIASLVAERIRQYTETFSFDCGAGAPIAMTASIGVTSLVGADDTPESILRRADAALYRAKNDGRNRVSEHIV
ncbi:MAG: PleD family two-component system response regulator [Alphaproteobacteria bacterium]|nr:PleD family two-component system response regulator [Alphaproteobacteria bacterium]